MPHKWNGNTPFKKGHKFGGYLIPKKKEVLYRAIHRRMATRWGKPDKCELCEKDKKRYYWANLNHKYSENREEWMTLCGSCHLIYDRSNLTVLKKVIELRKIFYPENEPIPKNYGNKLKLESL